jgi:hypothetical protein
MGVTAAELQQQQHASLTFFNKKTHKKEPKESKALTWLTAASPVLRMCGPEKKNWMKKI